MSEYTFLTTSDSVASFYPSVSWDGHLFTVSRIEFDATIFQADTTKPTVRFRCTEYGRGDGGVLRTRYTVTSTPLADLDGAVGDWPGDEDARLEPPAWFVAAVDAMIADALDLRAALVDEIHAEAREDRRRDWADEEAEYNHYLLGGRVL